MRGKAQRPAIELIETPVLLIPSCGLWVYVGCDDQTFSDLYFRWHIVILGLSVGASVPSSYL